AFLYCTNNYYTGKKTDYQTNRQKKTNINRDVCLQSEIQERSLVSFIQQSRPLMEQKDLNSCYKKRINFELSPKVDPLTI
ncbi:TPA: hypothetical protein ACHVGQ_001958, partial [Streptococcus suis]